MNTMTLEQMKNVDIRTVNPDDLVDIGDVKIDLGQPKSERIRDYVRQVKNPYCYKSGKIVIKSVFSENGGTLEDKLKSLMMKM